MGRQQGMSGLSDGLERNCFFNNLLTLTKFRKLAPPSPPLPPARSAGIRPCGGG